MAFLYRKLLYCLSLSRSLLVLEGNGLTEVSFSCLEQLVSCTPSCLLQVSSHGAFKFSLVRQLYVVHNFILNMWKSLDSINWELDMCNIKSFSK